MRQTRMENRLTPFGGKFCECGGCILVAETILFQGVQYFSLEESLKRIQNKLTNMANSPSVDFHVCVSNVLKCIHFICISVCNN